jgi:hypothetical protein
VPVAQGTGGNVAISVMYKEFGIRLHFTPEINGSRVHLKVRPEVSTLDFANAVTLQGFRIPALSTRRTETELELNDGQTFAIAGLLNNSVNSTLQKIPGIGDIPILGLLFKSKSAQKNQTELVVMITPQILNRTSPGVTPNLPRQQEPYLPPMPQKRSFDPPPPAFTPARGSAAASPAVVAPAAPAGSPAAAAAAVSALTPSANAPARAQTPQPQTQQPAPLAATPISATTADGSPRPMTAEERKAFDRARQQDDKAKKSDSKANTQAAKTQARQDELNRNAAKAQQEQDAKIAKEKAKLEKEKAKRDAEAAKVAAAKAKRQAEIDRAHQKELDEAAAKAREAEARYQAALAKSQK